MALSLDAPIEDLKLSNRLRNVLRRRGFNTLGSLLQRDYKPALRGFGPVLRAELAGALVSNGFALPANLSSECSAVSEAAWQHPIVTRHPGQGTSIVAHAPAQEFNDPLTVIRAASACLLLATELNARQRELVVLVEEEAVRLTCLVYQLFDALLPEKAISWPASNQKDVLQPVNQGAFADESVLAWCEFQPRVTKQARPIEPEETWRTQFDKVRPS